MAVECEGSCLCSMSGYSAAQREAAKWDGQEVIGVGYMFDMDALDSYVDMDRTELDALRRCCFEKPLFPLLCNGWTRYMFSLTGSGWCTDFIIEMLDRAGKLKALIDGKIPFNAQPFSHVVSEAYCEWKSDEVFVYEEKDFVDSQDLLGKCNGRPVFAPNNPMPRNPIMGRHWARRTVQTLASHKTLHQQILAGKLCFLGQPLSEVVAGAELVGKMVFEEADFRVPFIMRNPMHSKLQKAVLGCPVFLPDEGCEFVLAWKNDRNTRLWPLYLLKVILYTLPWLAQQIISGHLKLDGRRLTDIGLNPLPIYNVDPGVRLHLFKCQTKWSASYGKPWVSIADFPQQKPDWAVELTDFEYVKFLRNQAVFPRVLDARKPGDSHIDKDRAIEFDEHRRTGFYNEKHWFLYSFLVTN